MEREKSDKVELKNASAPCMANVSASCEDRLINLERARDNSLAEQRECRGGLAVLTVAHVSWDFTYVSAERRSISNNASRLD
jgi:hypothetical protein